MLVKTRRTSTEGLGEIIAGKLLTARGVYGIFRASSVGAFMKVLRLASERSVRLRDARFAVES